MAKEKKVPKKKLSTEKVVTKPIVETKEITQSDVEKSELADKVKEKAIHNKGLTVQPHGSKFLVKKFSDTGALMGTYFSETNPLEDK